MLYHRAIPILCWPRTRVTLRMRKQPLLYSALVKDDGWVTEPEDGGEASYYEQT